MKNAVLQIKKFYDIEKNQYLKNFQVRNNKIKYSDGYINFEKQLNYNFEIDFEIDIKAAYEVMKNIKSIESAEIKDNFLVINNFHKLPINKIEKTEEKTDEETGEKKLIIENLKLKEIKDFLNIKTIFPQNVLASVCFRKNEIALTDGNRLNVMEIKNNIEENQTFLINAELLKKLNNESINIYADDKYIYIIDSIESVELHPELITIQNEKLEYPNYKQLLPHHENKVEIKNVKEILAFLKSIKNYVNKRTEVIILKNNKLYCNDDNNISYNFDFKFFNFEELEYIGINYNYLINLLNYMESDFVLYYSGNLSPLYAVNGNKKTLLMPIQIRDDIAKYETAETAQEETETEKQPDNTETEEKQNISELETAENELEENQVVSEIAEEPQNKTESEEIKENINNSYEFKKEISLDEMPEEMKNALNESIKNLENSEEYKNFIQKQKEQKTPVSDVLPENDLSESEEKKINNELIKAELKEEKQKVVSAIDKHINYVTGHEYSGNNLKTLNDFMKQNNFSESAWMGSYQAKKIKMQLKNNAKPVIIQVFHENIDGTIFKMSESVYNIADFEKIKKVEETEDFKNVLEDIKKAV